MGMRVRLRNVFLLMLFSVVASSCMHVSARHYVDGDTKGEKGFVAYRAVPHLLVKHTDAKDQPRSVEVVYFPDTSDRTVFKVSGIFGSAEMGFTLEGDMLKQFNLKQDSKTPETIGAIGTAATPFTTLLGTAVGAGSELGGSLITALSGIATELIKSRQPAAMVVGAKLTPQESFSLAIEELSDRASDFAGVLNQGSIKDDVGKVGAVLATLAEKARGTDFNDLDDVLVLRRQVATAATNLSKSVPDGTTLSVEQQQAKKNFEDGLAEVSRMFEIVVAGLKTDIPGSFELYRLDEESNSVVKLWPPN